MCTFTSKANLHHFNIVETHIKWILCDFLELDYCHVVLILKYRIKGAPP